MKLPFRLVSATSHTRMHRENAELRQALERANAELLRHRRLLNALASGEEETTRSFERVLAVRKGTAP